MAKMILGSVLAAMLVGGGGCGSGVVPDYENCGAVSQFGECTAGSPGGGGGGVCEKGCDCLAQIFPDEGAGIEECVADCIADPPPAACAACIETNSCEVIFSELSPCEAACADDANPQ